MAKSNERNAFSVSTEIKKALMELLSEKNYADITVTDIVKKANVARTSFYRNFSSIENVVDSIVEERSQFFEEEILPVLHSDDERKWREFLFHYFYQISSDYKKLRKINMFNIYGMQNMPVFFMKVKEKINCNQKENPQSSIHDKYCAQGKFALICEIAKKWTISGMTETPEEMVDFLMGFITRF